jgi:hypothetical protein
MKSGSILLLVLMSVGLFGCAYHQQLHRFYALTEKELSEARKVALEAAASPESWQRVGGKRLTQEPLKLDETKTTYDLDCDHNDRIEVTIPSGSTFGWHGCYVQVTVSRTTQQVLEMYEGYWP